MYNKSIPLLAQYQFAHRTFIECIIKNFIEMGLESVVSLLVSSGSFYIRICRVFPIF